MEAMVAFPDLSPLDRAEFELFARFAFSDFGEALEDPDPLIAQRARGQLAGTTLYKFRSCMVRSQQIRSTDRDDSCNYRHSGLS